MITLAFYKGRGSSWWSRVQDGAIRFATRSPYSHVELIEGWADPGQEAVCLSASGRDGGVREKTILLKPDHWDLVDMADQPAGIGGFIRDRIGARYDYWGILFSQVLSLGRHDADRWFCSEICAAALGMPNAQRMSPQALYDVVMWSRTSGQTGPRTPAPPDQPPAT
ncbi:hypothetical protein OB2597_02537 [Pseudooceanicola batsensis HTCC2597]|uniref:Enoyl-CoA hydratase n=1 Tax=Pseudooceanicola batsensis (strain ATCC BAA-863 / DSM 15984 / KCTC 12145 / HTCC2597) TaxID=252305 RepID=A3TXA1_PSEBH|nr:hypothetical protein [Pseudooceanicola batsensis]EAQ03461.1 hypothetical protein OB2597_02537 [Pseudooceanicola batsensis HTCC2597]